MSQRHVIGFAQIGLIVSPLLILFFQNCAPAHLESDAIQSLSQPSKGDPSDCNSYLLAGFQNGYHQHTSAAGKCATCHAPGGPGNGKFGDPNLANAFNEFNSADRENKIPNRAIDGHGGSITSAANQGWVDSSKAIYTAAKAEWQACLLAKGDSPVEGGGGTPTRRLVNKPLNIANVAVGTYTNFTWNLSTEFQAAGDNRPGNAALTIEVTRFIQTAVNPPQNFYKIRNPRIAVPQGGQAVHLKDLRFYFNNAYFSDGSAFQIADRRIAVGATRSVMIFNGANEVIIPIPSNVFDNADTIGPVIGSLENVVFAPPTFANLQAQVFNTAACNTCHSAANAAANGGGLVVTTFAGLVTARPGIVVPYFPDASRVHQRMNNVNNPMPAGGLLPEAQRNLVRDWIWDGAPP